MGEKRNDFEDKLYDIVWRVISYYDFLDIFGCGCPHDEYSGEIGKIFHDIKHNLDIDNISLAIKNAFRFNLATNKDVINLMTLAASDIYRKVMVEDHTRKKLNGILISDEIVTDLYCGLDFDDLKEGDICSVSDLARHIDSSEVGSNYLDTLTDKVYKITDDGIIFSNTEEQFNEQTNLHYYDKRTSTFYYLESNKFRYVVYMWDIDSYGNLCETVVDWFCIDGSKTPEHIINTAIRNGAFNNIRMFSKE